MAVSKTTQLTDKLMAEIAKCDPEDALRALGFLHGEATNRVYDIDGVSWDDKRAVLKRNAEFAQARYDQSLGLVDAEADPDEDLL